MLQSATLSCPTMYYFLWNFAFPDHGLQFISLHFSDIYSFVAIALILEESPWH